MMNTAIYGNGYMAILKSIDILFSAKWKSYFFCADFQYNAGLTLRPLLTPFCRLFIVCHHLSFCFYKLLLLICYKIFEALVLKSIAMPHNFSYLIYIQIKYLFS